MTNIEIHRVKDIAQIFGVSRQTVWNWCNPKSRHYRADFPQPFKVSANVTGWHSGEIAAYIETLAAKRQHKAQQAA